VGTRDKMEIIQLVMLDHEIVVPLVIIALLLLGI